MTKERKPLINNPTSFKYLALLFPVILSACSEQAAPSAQATAPGPGVVVYSVGNTPIGSHREFVARTVPFQEANITARVEGELIKRYFKEGSTVEKDQLLFEIDPAAYNASLSQAKADLESKESAAERAKRNLKRGQDVAGKGFISQSDLDQLIAEDLQTKAAVSSSKAALEKAELDLGYTTIKAPFAGRIGKVSYNTGNIVSPSSGTLATLTANDPMYVSFQIEEAEMVSYMQANTANAKPKDAAIDVSLRLPNNTMYDQQGVLEFADTKIDEGTGTIELLATFKNPKGVILPGLFVTLLIDGHDKESKVLVPQMAVQESMQGKFVLVVDEKNIVSQRPVTLGRRINAMWVVDSGIKAGERVIIQGLQKVRTGIAVTPTEKTINTESGVVTDLVQ